MSLVNNETKTLLCHKCSTITSNPTELINHLKVVHQIRNHCSLCSSTFDQLFKFRKHTEKCFKKKTIRTDLKQNVFLQEVNHDYQIYEDLTKDGALDFACKLAGNMNVARSSVFDVIDDAKRYLNCITEGMQNLVLPWLKQENVNDFKNIIGIIGESLESVDAEYKLDKLLSDRKLIGSVRKVKVGERAIDPLIHSDSDDDTDDPSKSETVTLMPIHFQIQSFFELPNVFEKLQSNEDTIKKDGKLNHFINGKIWKSKLEHYSKDDIVIPYHLHIDDTQTNNALGTHTTKGDQTCVYYSFPTMPNEYASRLENIFTAQVFESRLSLDFGNEQCYDELIKELNKLADNGIILNINGKEQKVYFVMGLLLGDNKGLNHCLGYTKGFRANYYCRFCRMRRSQMLYSYVDDDDYIRNIEMYYEDLAIGKMSETGICEDSVFNKVRYFHATQTCADVMHDVNEGVLHYNLCEIIIYFIDNGFFSLEMLNKEKQDIKYGDHEENNRSKNITIDNLKARKLKMSASEVHSFAHHLPFILLNIIDEEIHDNLEGNEVWRFLLTTLRFLDMTYLPSYDGHTILTLRNVVATMNEMYVRLFDQTLKPKHHFTTHYHRLIENCGPLRYISSMRYEANHKFVKNYTKNTTSRRNISYSLGLKLQYNFAYLLKKGKVCNDIVEISKPKITNLSAEDFYQYIVPSNHLETLNHRSIYVSEKVKFNGLTLSSKSCLPFIDGNQMYLLQIVKLIIMEKDDPSSIRVVCKKYVNVQYETNYASYTATDLQPQIHIISLSDVLRNRIFPVALHRVNGLNLFRYKTF